VTIAAAAVTAAETEVDINPKPLFL